MDSLMFAMLAAVVDRTSLTFSTRWQEQVALVQVVVLVALVVQTARLATKQKALVKTGAFFSFLGG